MIVDISWAPKNSFWSPTREEGTAPCNSSQRHTLAASAIFDASRGIFLKLRVR